MQIHSPDYTVILHPETEANMVAYRDHLRSKGIHSAGARLARRLAGSGEIEVATLIRCILNTKLPMIFAESEVRGDGSDWTARELSLLGDIGIATDVTIFDDGRHSRPRMHDQPFKGHLLFVPGALLRCDSGGVPADREAVVRDRQIDQQAYEQLYERRLLPLLLHADTKAAASGTLALVTIPGLGCGQFAGPFKGTVGEHLRNALIALLEQYGRLLPNIAAIYYDPYSECRNERHRFGDLSFLVRPLTGGNEGKPQLCHPQVYAEEGDDFGGCTLFSFVAWDHVSWPGNDFFGGSRSTDDGVKAAASSSMLAMTGIAGNYDTASNCYLPPAGFSDWGHVIRKLDLRLEVEGRLKVIGSTGFPGAGTTVDSRMSQSEARPGTARIQSIIDGNNA